MVLGRKRELGSKATWVTPSDAHSLECGDLSPLSLETLPLMSQDSQPKESSDKSEHSKVVCRMS
jgi:hypothetical protein